MWWRWLGEYWIYYAHLYLSIYIFIHISQGFVTKAREKKIYEKIYNLLFSLRKIIAFQYQYISLSLPDFMLNLRVLWVNNDMGFICVYSKIFKSCLKNMMKITLGRHLIFILHVFLRISTHRVHECIVSFIWCVWNYARNWFFFCFLRIINKRFTVKYKKISTDDSYFSKVCTIILTTQSLFVWIICGLYLWQWQRYPLIKML